MSYKLFSPCPNPEENQTTWESAGQTIDHMSSCAGVNGFWSGLTVVWSRNKNTLCPCVKEIGGQADCSETDYISAQQNACEL